MAGFDRSYLPEAQIEYVVLSDTHHIADPNMYAQQGDSVSPELTGTWSKRGDWALRVAKALEPTLAFHVGDLTQEYPGHPTFDAGRRAALAQMSLAGFALHHVAGNMDIGDKPDPTMPAGGVEPSYLEKWNATFGRTYFSLSESGTHFIVLNSQILNSGLQEAIDQRTWLVADLAAHVSEPIVVFLHVPLFLVDEDEPGLGSYDVIDQPDRTWLLGLMRSHNVVAVFSGHTHFQVFNRAGQIRLYTMPSTTTTRPGFHEAFAVAPPSRGWADVAKLGFFLVRMAHGNIAVHLIRTGGRVEPEGRAGMSLITRVSRDLPGSPLGAYLRLPIANRSDGAIAYPNLVRNRIRDDYPLLACVELGLSYVRFPIQDLAERVQRDRLHALRDEGLQLTATMISTGSTEGDSQIPRAIEADAVEIQLAGRLLPTDRDLAAIAALRAEGLVVAVAPIVMEQVGKVHHRSRTGYRTADLVAIDDFLTEQRCRIDRAVCAVGGTGESPWTTVREFAAIRRRSIEALEFVLQLGEDHLDNVKIVAEGIVAAATVPNCRLVIDPLQDLDRTAAVMGGLLDRLSNPRPAFHVARVLNTVLFSHPAPKSGYTPLELEPVSGRVVARGLEGGGRQFWLINADTRKEASDALANRLKGHEGLKVIDLVAGESMQSSWRTLRQDLEPVRDSTVLVCAEAAP